MNSNLSNDGLKIKSFLQGVDLYTENQGKLGIKQNNAYYSEKKIYFSFSSPGKNSIVRALTISVILFNVNTPSILYADGSIDQNFVISTTNVTIPRHGIN
jgi:hypothetical protein